LPRSPTPALDLIVFCPSNPFVSIAPILSLGDISDSLAKSSAFKIAVSPIVGGAAIKGPAAHMMRDLGLDVSVLGIARHYKDIIDGLIIDEIDRHYCRKFTPLVCKPWRCRPS